MNETKHKNRIPFRVESPRGDDRLGTTPSGTIISDFEAKEKGVPFELGVPNEQVQKAVETQLNKDKWVSIEKKDGSTELLTKKDIPQLYPAPVENPQADAVKVEQPKEQQKPSEDWRDAFKVDAKPVKPTVKPTAVSQTCAEKPKKEKIEWESKFQDIKSATATNKGKGG